MRSPWIVALVALSSSAFGQEVPDPEIAEVPEATPTAVSAALGRALGDRFVACAAAEGGALSEADRALVGESVAPLATAVARSLGADACAGTDAEARCVSVVRAADCDSLARALLDAPGAMSGAATPSWATSYARTLVDRITSCLAAERDAGPSDEEVEALSGLRRSLASTFGLLVASGRCRIDENALPACVASAAAVSCEPLGEHLEGDPAGLASGVTPECGQFLRCGDDDGGAGEAPEDAAGLIPE